MPAGETAPASGVAVYINDGWCFIPPGQNRAFFALRIPPNDPEKILKFEVASKDSPYIRRTCYNAARGLVADRSQASLLDLSSPDPNAIDITLIKAPAGE